MAASPPLPAGDRRGLRTHFKRILKMHDPQLDKRIVLRLYRWIMRHFPADQHPIIACTWPLEGEIDLRPLCYALVRENYKVALPQTTAPGHGLVFRLWDPHTQLIKGRFNTYYPSGKLVTPDLIIVPLLAFDDTGGRLGYGGGYYDRTLAQLHSVTTIGYATDAQRTHHIPHQQWDIPLSYLATQSTLYHFTAPKDKGSHR